MKVLGARAVYLAFNVDGDFCAAYFWLFAILLVDNYYQGVGATIRVINLPI